MMVEENSLKSKVDFVDANIAFKANWRKCQYSIGNLYRVSASHEYGKFVVMI